MFSNAKQIFFHVYSRRKISKIQLNTREGWDCFGRGIVIPYSRTCVLPSSADGPLGRNYVGTASIGIHNILLMGQSAHSIQLDEKNR